MSRKQRLIARLADLLGYVASALILLGLLLLFLGWTEDGRFWPLIAVREAMP